MRPRAPAPSELYSTLNSILIFSLSFLDHVARYSRDDQCHTADSAREAKLSCRTRLGTGDRRGLGEVISPSAVIKHSEELDLPRIQTKSQSSSYWRY